MASVASQSNIKDFSITSSDRDAVSLTSITSLERHAIQYQADVERFATPSLNKQKFLVSDDKKDEIATLAVCAKLEKAIGRRLSLQDAEFTKKTGASVPSAMKSAPLVPAQESEKVSGGRTVPRTIA